MLFQSVVKLTYLMLLFQTANAQTIQIKKIKISGTGCSDSNTAVSLSPDNKALTLTFSEFNVESDAYDQQAPVIQKTNCRVALVVEPSGGYTFAIAAVDYRGFVSLDRKAVAVHTTRYKMSREEKEIIKTKFKGPVDKDFQRFDNIVRAEQIEYLPCRGQKKLVINNVLKVRARPNSSGYIAIDSIDAEVGGSMRYKLKWRKCTV